jgi:hypothetical protein
MAFFVKEIPYRLNISGETMIGIDSLNFIIVYNYEISSHEKELPEKR